MTNRVKLNLRVTREAKEQFEAALQDKFGTIRPYAGVRLEDEFRARLDEGELGDLQTAVDEVGGVHGITDREKKFSSSERDGSETAVVSYRVAEDIRARLLDYAERESWRSAGDYVEAVMRCYAAVGSVAERAIDRLDRVRAAGQRLVDDEISSTERRTRAIAEYLERDGGDSFTLDEFNEAVSEAATGVDAGRYARLNYLPRVLDHLSYTWHPRRADLFIDRGVLQPADERDVRKKPYILMSEDDRKLAVKIEALATLSRGTGSLTTGEALDVLNGRPQRKTVNSILREISSCDGFRYEENRAGDKVLKIDRSKAAANNPTAARLAGVVDDPDDPDDEATNRRAAESDREPAARADDESAGGWVAEAAENVPADLGATAPDAVLNNKIARARWPGRVEEADHETTLDALDAVCEADRERVRETLRDDPDDEATDRHATGSDRDTAAEADDDPAARLDELSAASEHQARTDGGLDSREQIDSEK
jgi:hypothetical protein